MSGNGSTALIVSALTDIILEERESDIERESGLLVSLSLSLSLRMNGYDEPTADSAKRALMMAADTDKTCTPVSLSVWPACSKLNVRIDLSSSFISEVLKVQSSAF